MLEEWRAIINKHMAKVRVFNNSISTSDMTQLSYDCMVEAVGKNREMYEKQILELNIKLSTALAKMAELEEKAAKRK